LLEEIDITKRPIVKHYIQSPRRIMGSRKQRKQKNKEKEEEPEHDLEAMEKLLNEDSSSSDDDNVDAKDDDGSTASESLPSGQEDSDSNEQDEDSGDGSDELEVESLKSSDEEEASHPVEDESMDGDDENEDGEEEEEEESTSDDDDGEEEEPQDSTSSPSENNTSLQDEKCSFDIRNLTVIDPHQVNTNLLYKSTKKKKNTPDDDEIYTISTPGLDKVNEEYLLEKASEGCTQLLEELWNLDMENAIATLPSYCTTTIPRSLVSY